MGASGHDWALTKRARGNKTSVGVSGIGGGRLPLVRNHHHLRGNSSPLQWEIVNIRVGVSGTGGKSPLVGNHNHLRVKSSITISVEESGSGGETLSFMKV